MKTTNLLSFNIIISFHIHTQKRNWLHNIILRRQENTWANVCQSTFFSVSQIRFPWIDVTLLTNIQQQKLNRYHNAVGIVMLWCWVCFTQNSDPLTRLSRNYHVHYRWKIIGQPKPMLDVCTGTGLLGVRSKQAADTVKPLTSNTPSCRTKSVAQEGVLLARGFRM